MNSSVGKGFELVGGDEGFKVRAHLVREVDGDAGVSFGAGGHGVAPVRANDGVQPAALIGRRDSEEGARPEGREGPAAGARARLGDALAQQPQQAAAGCTDRPRSRPRSSTGGWRGDGGGSRSGGLLDGQLGPQVPPVVGPEVGAGDDAGQCPLNLDAPSGGDGADAGLPLIDSLGRDAEQAGQPRRIAGGLDGSGDGRGRGGDRRGDVHSPQVKASLGKFQAFFPAFLEPGSKRSATHMQKMLVGPELGAAIKVAIEKKGWSKSKVARHFEVTPQAVDGWIQFGRINKSKLPELYAFFGEIVGPEHWGLPPTSPLVTLMTPPKPAPGDDQQLDHVAVPAVLARIPVLGRARGGPDDSFFEESFEPGDRMGDIMYPSFGQECYAVQIVGDSMEPRYQHGEYVIAYRKVLPVSGDYVFVRFKDGRRMCKRVQMLEEGWVRLESINTQYKPITVQLTELEEERGLEVIAGPVPKRFFLPYVHGI